MYLNRQNIYDNIFSARSLFITGLLIMPALLFNPGTEYRVIQFLFFWFLTWLSGKKTKPLFTLFIITCIVIFNLLIPYGKVLFSAGIFKITSGALIAGIHRAVTLQALVMLSKITVRQDLIIPGFFGGLLSDSFRLFSVMLNRKYRITGGINNSFGINRLIAEIDNMLLEVSSDNVIQPSVQIQKTKPAGFIILSVVVILSWLPWGLGIYSLLTI